MDALLTRSSDNKFFRVMRIIICGLKVIGLAPFSIQRSTETTAPNDSRRSCCTGSFLVSKIGLAYNVSLSILVLIAGAAATPQLFYMTYPNKSPITQVVDVMQAILRTSTSSVVILSWAFRQSSAISIMNRLTEVDRLLSDMNKDLRGEIKSSKFLTVQMIANAFFWLTLWASEGVYIHSFLDWFIFNVPIFVIHWFVMEYSMVLDTAARELESLNKNLMNFKDVPTCLFPRPSTVDHDPSVISLPTRCGQPTTLERLRSVRTTLTEVCQDIADFFSFLILPAVACLSLTIVYNLYYLITPLVIPINAPPVSTAINVVVWLLICLFPLILLSFNVTKTLKEAKLTGPIVHKLLAKARRQQTQTELERLSLQLLHGNLSFTAYGFFTLDFTLIQSIFGTTATYLVIIIQLMK